MRATFNIELRLASRAGIQCQTRQATRQVAAIVCGLKERFRAKKRHFAKKSGGFSLDQ
jgi:hypothetical protein